LNFKIGVILDKRATEIEVKCEQYPNGCFLPREMLHQLLKTTFLTVRSLDKKGMFYNRLIIFVYEMEKCVIHFLLEMNSQDDLNIQINPEILLTAQTILYSDYSKEPLIKLQAYAKRTFSEREKRKLWINLMRKYHSHLVPPEIVDLYVHEFDVVVEAKIQEISMWKGNITQKFKCKRFNQ
jgi:hypothetical protein